MICYEQLELARTRTMAVQAAQIRCGAFCQSEKRNQRNSVDLLPNLRASARDSFRRMTGETNIRHDAESWDTAPEFKLLSDIIMS